MSITCSCDHEFLSKSCRGMLIGITFIFIIIIFLFPFFSILDLISIFTENSCYIIHKNCILERNIIFGILAVYLTILIILFLTKIIKCKKVQKYHRVQNNEENEISLQKDNPPEYDNVVNQEI